MLGTGYLLLTFSLTLGLIKAVFLANAGPFIPGAMYGNPLYEPFGNWEIAALDAAPGPLLPIASEAPSDPLSFEWLRNRNNMAS